MFTQRRVRRIEGGALLLLATVGVILATLRPTEATATQLCIVCGPHAAVGAVVNVLLFIPFGAGLALLGVRWRTAILLGAAATVVIETLQLALPLGRAASISDLLTNTAGTAVGFYLSEHRRAIAYPRSRAALRYAVGISIAWFLVLLATAVALLPSVPNDAYVAQWTPSGVGFERYTGRVINTHVSGVPIPNGPVAQSDRLRPLLERGVMVEATFEPGGTPLRPAPIVRLVTEDSAEILLLAQRKGDLLFRSRVLASDMRFVTPTVVMSDAVLTFVPSENAPLVASAQRDRGQLRVGLLGRDAVLDLHAGAGWLLLFPAASSLQASADGLSGIWCGIPLFAAAYWAGRRARRRARRAGDAMRMRGAVGQNLLALPVLLASAVVGLSGISALFGLSQPSLGVWIGVITAIGAGLVIGSSLAMAHDDRAHGSSRHGTKASESLPRPEQAANA